MFNLLSKRDWEEHFLEIYGEKVMNDPNLRPGFFEKVWDLAQRNKGPIGLIFLSIYGWAFAESCPNEYGIDLTQGWFSCEHWKDLLGLIGAFLTGSGFLTKDEMIKRKQQIDSGVLPDSRKS